MDALVVKRAQGSSELPSGQVSIHLLKVNSSLLVELDDKH